MEITDWMRENMRDGMFHFPEDTEEQRMIPPPRRCGNCALANPMLSHMGQTVTVQCQKAATARRDIGLKTPPQSIDAGLPACKYWQAME